MTKGKVWCCHPTRHIGASKVGCVPSHPKGKYVASATLVNFLKKQYGSAAMKVPMNSNSGRLCVCTSCREFESDRLRKAESSRDERRVTNDESGMAKRLQRQASMNPLVVLDNDVFHSPQPSSHLKQAESSADDEAGILYDRCRTKDVCNDVLRTLAIEAISEMRNTDDIRNKINRACEILQNMCENLINLEKQRRKIDSIEEETSSLTLTERHELISGLKNLYNVSDKHEQVRLLTIAPSNWGRQRIENFFESSQWQARQARELRLSKGVLAFPDDRRGNQPLESAVIDAVKTFFDQDWISRVSSNKSDILLLKKQSVAKRFMLLTIDEAFEKFKNDFPQYEIGRSKFFELKPRHVYSIAPHDTCCCIYHENFDLVLKAWNRVSNEQIDRGRLINETLCVPPNESCFYRDCQLCGERQPSTFVRKSFDGDEDDEIEWTSWKRTENRMASRQVVGSVSLLLDDIDEQWKDFISHHHYTKMQQSAIAELKKKSDVNGMVLIQMDFAQNFSLTSQREVQSAHFDKPQVTLFTAFIVLGSVHKSYVIVSDYLEHDTKFVYAAQQYLIARVKEIAPHVHQVNYVTDGGPAHFKNRYNLLNLSFHEVDFGIPAVWTFSATSHGKGPVDAIGATIKSAATRYLMRHGPEEAFKSPKDFYTFSKQRQESSSTPIELFYLNSNRIASLHQKKNEDRWRNTKGLTGIRSFHQFAPVTFRTIRCWRTTTSTAFQTRRL
ncbi:unnamed protein product [Adineta ricciae]|uniref:Uncharacterized protein n=1 Tax=Adineta ricciae TaxID=249248 RepID=A0A815X5Z6_ADIRI|nr:unnamed protein product [Adineta ricciae]